MGRIFNGASQALTLCTVATSLDSFGRFRAVKNGLIDPVRPDALLHTMLRVGDLDRSLASTTGVLGMTLLRSRRLPEGRFTWPSWATETRRENSVLELTSTGIRPATPLGDGYGHIEQSALKTSPATCAAIATKAESGAATRPR